VVSNFDLAIVNMAHKVQLSLISPKLMKAYYEVDEEHYYQKVEIIIHGLRRMVGNGLTFAKGDVWKMKRRIVTKMLNFSYVHALVPKIQAIVRRNLAKMEKDATLT
jgi:cytochrome P450